MMMMSRPMAQRVFWNNLRHDDDVDDDEYELDDDVINQGSSSSCQSDGEACPIALKHPNSPPVASSFGNHLSVAISKKIFPATLKKDDKSPIDRNRPSSPASRNEIHEGRCHGDDDLSCSDPTWLPIYDLARETRESLEKLKTMTFSPSPRKEDIRANKQICAQNLTHFVGATPSTDVGGKDIVVTSSKPKRSGRIVYISSLVLPSASTSSSSSGQCDLNNNVCSDKDADVFSKTLKMIQTNKNNNNAVAVNVKCNKSFGNVYVVNVKYRNKKRGTREFFETKTFDNLAFEYL